MPLPRRRARYLQTAGLSLPFSHGAVSATNTPIVFAKTLTRAYRIDRVQYTNITGLATSASNYFDIRVLNSATIAAKWSTLTGSDGTLAANTENDLVLQAATTLIVPAGTALSLALVLTGTQTLPAGSGFVEVTVL